NRPDLGYCYFHMHSVGCWNISKYSHCYWASNCRKGTATFRFLFFPPVMDLRQSGIKRLCLYQFKGHFRPAVFKQPRSAAQQNWYNRNDQLIDQVLFKQFMDHLCTAIAVNVLALPGFQLPDQIARISGVKIGLSDLRSWASGDDIDLPVPVIVMGGTDFFDHIV